MTLKNLLILGLFGMIATGEAQAGPYQAPIRTDVNKNIQLVSTYQYYPHYTYPSYNYYYGHPHHWYHKKYSDLANQCRYHRFSFKSSKCKRFCGLNPHICLP